MRLTKQLLKAVCKLISEKEVLEKRILSLEKLLEPIIIRNGHIDERLEDIDTDIKRTWDYLGITKIPTERPKDTHILVKHNKK